MARLAPGPSPDALSRVDLSRGERCGDPLSSMGEGWGEGWRRSLQGQCLNMRTVNCQYAQRWMGCGLFYIYSDSAAVRRPGCMPGCTGVAITFSLGLVVVLPEILLQFNEVSSADINYVRSIKQQPAPVGR